MSSASSTTMVEDAEIILRPDSGTEEDFKVDNNPFAFSPDQLNKLLNPKSLPAFTALGGLRGIERGLRTSIESGLSADKATLPGHVTFSEATQPFQKAEHHQP